MQATLEAPPPLAKPPTLYELEDGRLRVNFHPGQLKAWDSEKRIVAIIAGGRSGKTSFAALWFYREMRKQGPGDYLMAAPNYPLIDKAAGPEMEMLFGKGMLDLGTMTHGPWQFEVSDAGAMKLWGRVPDRPSRIIFCHADKPQSIEAMSAKAAWLDESGQNEFKHDSWEAVRQRCAIDRGRILITSKPFNMGWMYQLIEVPWLAANRKHPQIDVIRFDSTENPVFPIEEMEEAFRRMPLWKYNQQYRGIFTRPAGLIYTSFDDTRHRIPRIDIPEQWPRYIGLDFGGVNTAAIFLAEEHYDGKPTGRLIAYREYLAGERSAVQHVHELLKGEPRTPICAGGSKSEGQWRREFAAGGTVVINGVSTRVQGLPIHAPMQVMRGNEESIVEVGINKVFAAFSLDKLLVFSDLHGLLDELGSYSRELDDAGEPTKKIESKDSYHRLDALRYIIGHLNPDKPQESMKYRSPVARPGLSGL